MRWRPSSTTALRSTSISLKRKFPHLRQTNYCPKHQPPRHYSSDFFGRVPSGRAIAQYLSGRDKAYYSNTLAPRAQKGYLRISLTRSASCLEKISPAIAAAPRVRRARAPGNAPRCPRKTYWPKDQPHGSVRHNPFILYLTAIKLLPKIPASDNFRNADAICVHLENHRSGAKSEQPAVRPEHSREAE